jgi:hypothetical protein
LEAEHLDAKDALVHTLKNGNPKVYKADLRAKYRLSKDLLFDFSHKNPNILEGYKRDLAKKAETPVGNQVIENRQAEGRQINARTTAEELKSIPSGAQDANRYHDFILGALTEILSPMLTRPRKEQKIDEGRKRIDISFSNSATGGFFAKLAHLHRYVTPYIPIECKNYSEDLKNPEFDQMLGRLSRKRGMFGIIVCRKIDGPELVLKRCRDVVNNDPEKAIIILDDNDIEALLTLRADGKEKEISDYLDEKLRAILN